MATDAGELVLELDPEGVIVAVNDASEAVTGYAADDLLGRPYHHLVAPEHSGLVTREFERKRRDPQLVSHYQAAILRSDGSKRLVDVRSRRIDQQGAPLRVRVTARIVG